MDHSGSDYIEATFDMGREQSTASSSSSKSRASSLSGDSSDNESIRTDDLDAVVPQKRPQAGRSQSKHSVALPSVPSIQASKFAPPAGMVPITVTSEFASSLFEFDKMAQRPDLELWAIRVPSNVKPSKLSQLVVHKDLSGSLKAKSHKYALINAGKPKKAHAVVDSEGREPLAGPRLADAMAVNVDSGESSQLRSEGGEEMLGGMRLMVPRIRAGGKLLVAPLPITRHMLLAPDALPQPEAASAPLPSFLSETVPDSTVFVSNAPSSTLPQKRQQPTNLLKFRNRAFGFDTPGPERASASSVKEKSRPAKKKKSQA